MNFAHPAYLAAGVLACGVLLLVWRRHDARQKAALETLLAPHLRAELTASVSKARRIGQRSLFGAAIALLFVALASPVGGFHWERTTRRGNDIMFAVDTSRSMLTPDVKPNRLARAKLAIDDFVSHLDGDAVGLVAFAGTAFLQTPMTLDYGAFHDSLNALDTHVIPVGGTNISSAIREAAAALRNRPGSDKVLILVTDGEDLQGDALGAAKAAAKQDGLKIYTVGVGTANGELIPLPPEQGGGFLRDAEGRLVKSHLDEAGLRALAAATGGTYAPLGNTNQGLETIYQEALAPLAKHELQARAQRVYTQLYQWPLAGSLALLLGSLLVGSRRRVAKMRMDSKTTGNVGTRSMRKLVLPTAAALVFAMALLPYGSAHASPASAVKAYNSGNFAAAESEYSKAAQRSPREPLLQYDAGAAAYKAGDYPQAASAFQASVNAAKSGSAKRLAEQEDAYYNLGNSLYREGQKSRQSNADETLSTWSRAVKAYDAALQLRANDPDSQFNRDFVQRQIDALKKQQQQKQQQQQQQKQPQQAQQHQAQQKQQQGGQAQQSAQQKGATGQQSKPPSAKDNSQPQAGSSSSGGKGETPAQKQGDAKADNPGGKDQGLAGNPPANAGRQPQAGQTPPPASTAGAPSAPGGQAGPGGQSGTDQSAVQQTARAADDQRVPGQMSRAEARELLDSVKDEQQHLPAAPLARSGSADSPPSDEPLKDW